MQSAGAPREGFEDGLDGEGVFFVEKLNLTYSSAVWELSQLTAMQGTGPVFRTTPRTHAVPPKRTIIHCPLARVY